MKKNNRKTYAQFLSLILSFSALTLPVYGEDWDQVLNPEGTIRLQALSLLDDPSLGRVAQVSKNWNRLIQKTRDLENPSVYSLSGPLILSQRSLTNNILESTHAVLDSFSPLIQEIRKITNLSSQEKGRIKNKFPNLTDPSLSLYPWHLLRDLEEVRDEKVLAPTHKGFRRLKEVIETLKTMESTFSTRTSSLQGLRTSYEAYMANLCALKSGDRGLLLSPVFLHGDFIKGTYLISKTLAYQLLSMTERGISDKKNATGSSIVTHVGNIYAKQNLIRAKTKEETPTGTLDPGMEWAMSSFHRLLFGEGLVSSSLITLSSVPIKQPLSQEKQEEERRLTAEAQDINTAAINKTALMNRLDEDLSFKNTQNYALQVTPDIQGEFLGTFLERALKNPSLFEELDKPQVQGLILSALLTHPADAKGDNYIVTKPDARGKRQIISIDNDLNLASMVIKEKENFHTLETRNILFCIPAFMQQEIDDGIRQHLLSLDPECVVLSWLKGLASHNAAYDRLGQEATALLNLPLKLKPGIGMELLERLQNLQKYLRRTDFLHPTLQILFEEMDPLAALYTQRIIEMENNPLKAFDRIYRQDIPLEKAMTPTDSLRSGQRVRDALQEETTLKDGYRTRTQPIEDSVKELLRKVDLFQHPHLNAFLTTAIENFGDLIKTSGASFLHNSWSRDGLILKAIEARTPEFVLNSLLEKGLDGSVTDAEQRTALRYAVERKALPSLLHLLHKHYKGKDIVAWLNTKTKDGLTALDVAFHNQQLEHVKVLIDLGASSCNPSLALKFYETILKVKNIPSLKNSFIQLMQRNDEVRWHICLEEMLPSRYVSQQDIPVFLSGGKTRYLPRMIKDQILTKDNKWIPYTQEGNHIVCRATFGDHGLYFKVYPELPGIEEAVGSLTRMILGYGAPYTDLAKINGVPVLISHSHGDKTKTLDYVLHHSPELLKDLDEESLEGLILVAMLINPEDGKPSNYVTEEHPTKPGKYRLVGIDNDHAFVPAIVMEKPQKAFLSQKPVPIAQVKTILYGLDQMKTPFHPSIRELFINLQPDMLLEAWLQNLQKIHQSENALFANKQDQHNLFSQHDCVIGVPFQREAIAHLYDKFVILRDVLDRFPTITPIEILRKLEPRLAKRYEPALDQVSTVKERWTQGDALFYETQKNGSQTTMTRSGHILKSMDIPEKETLFESIRNRKANGPDQALEELKKIKEELQTKTLEELGARAGDLNILKILQLGSTRAKFLEKKDFKDVDLREQEAILAYLKDKALRKLFLKNCLALNDSILTQGLSLGNLVTCDLRGCENITSQGLLYLSQTALALEELNLSNIKSLKEIGDIGVFRADRALIFKELKFLILSNMIKLTKLFVQAPQLQLLDVENCLRLTDQMLDGVIEGSENLQKLNFKGCPLIKDKKIRGYFPNYTASCHGKEDLLGILESQGSSLQANIFQLTSQELSFFEKALKINKNLTNLTNLDLSYSLMRDQEQCLAVLSTTGNLTNLMQLNLRKSQIDDAGVQSLAYGNLRALIELNLERDLSRNEENFIGVVGAQALANGNLMNLTTLSLQFNKVGDTGAQVLATGNLTNLTDLNLSGNNIGAIGAQSLATGNLISLTYLNLCNNNIGDAGAQALAEGNLMALMKLKLINTDVGDVGEEMLKLRYPTIYPFSY